MSLFGERGEDFNCIKNEHHSNSEKKPQSVGHTNEWNYLGVVVYSALHMRYFLPDLWKGL
jgi:hypothetical protein